MKACRHGTPIALSTLALAISPSTETLADFYVHPTAEQIDACQRPWYCLGSAALTRSGIAYLGNENGNFYAVRMSDMTQLDSMFTGYYYVDYLAYTSVCSSPAITYSAGDGARWVYVVSRGNNGRPDNEGTLFAFKTQ
ncbi:MAG: hypothetical protein A2Z18_10800 [Armatimonadetes bacterium RBG_16_58_9]|nr:MAG: hypothetical protein A2Z18_10800 [Armatimonadetes bacterium RBG_16_58_9]